MKINSMSRFLKIKLKNQTSPEFSSQGFGCPCRGPHKHTVRGPEHLTKTAWVRGTQPLTQRPAHRPLPNSSAPRSHPICASWCFFTHTPKYRKKKKKGKDNLLESGLTPCRRRRILFVMLPVSCLVSLSQGSKCSSFHFLPTVRPQRTPWRAAYSN